MTILILSRLSTATGNASTAVRISDYYTKAGHNCLLKCPTAYPDADTFSAFLEKERIQFVIGIHAFRSGRLLCDVSVPFVIVFGGTDLNESFKNEEKFSVMSKAVANARLLVAFCGSMKEKALTHWPKEKMKIRVQAQGIGNIFPSGFCLDEYLTGNRIANESLDSKIVGRRPVIFLLVCGLRPIKDPLFLVNAVSEWHKRDDRICLVIVGPELNPEFSSSVRDTIESLPGIFYIPYLQQNDLHSVMKSSFAVVNTSINEGMAGALLESMAAGTVVLARDNPGNAEVVHHFQNGLLFSSPTEFVNLSRLLLLSPEIRVKLQSSALASVQSRHSVAKECQFYLDLVASYV